MDVMAIMNYGRVSFCFLVFLMQLHYAVLVPVTNVTIVTLPLLNKTNELCIWNKSVVRNGKLKGGFGAGTFHRLGYAPNMATCIDLCCNMDVCGVAFRNKEDCFGIECNSDDSCDSVPAEASDIPVEIAHVRAGHKTGNLTDLTMAGQCKPSPVYNEVTLKGGINAGTYKDVGGVNTMEECQNKCCEFSACDLAFMLAGSCYLVGCIDQKQCAMQPAKQSKFTPTISYVTRWNKEGVKHTVLLQEKDVQYRCPKMNPLTKVTLKGGLQAGDFTDVGKVATLEQCYDICCQQDKCDLAFMLGQNCFSVQCKDKRLCQTTPAQPSIFNPQIAYAVRRDKVGIDVKSAIAKAPTSVGASGICPKTKILDKMTLKGGVDAGAYKDHGKVKDMDICRRICCEMTECHLAFMLGNNCFSVKCASVDACRAQKAKPSAYYPKISYLRKVGTNKLLPNMADVTAVANNTDPLSAIASLSASIQQPGAAHQSIPAVAAAVTAQPKVPANPPEAAENKGSALVQQVKAMPENAQGFAVTPNGLKALASANSKPDTNSNTTSQIVATNGTSHPTKDATNVQLTESKNNLTTGDMESPVTLKDQELLHALEPAETNTTTQKTKMPINDEKCELGLLKKNVTLKGGRKSGEFIEIKGLKDMKMCVKRCCEDRDKKCNLAFMLGDTCYSVACKSKDLCKTISAPATKFNPQVQYVRGLEEVSIPSSTVTPQTPTTTVTEIKDTAPASKDDISSDSNETEEKPKTDNKQKQNVKQKSCVSQPIVRNKSIRGGKKAGKFKVFKDIKDMDTCIAKCCSLKQDCDVAYMETGRCFSIQCFKKSACTAVDLRDTEIDPQFCYMDHFLEKVDEEEAENDLSTDLDIAEDSACTNVEIATNKTLKGGTRAGKFRPMGKKDMKSCINTCCDRPDCDIAYSLNGHCYSVECNNGKLCQATGEPSRAGDSVQLAYMNKAGLGDKRRDYMVVYIIVGSLAFAAILGGLIWAVFAFTRKQKIKKKSHKQRLLDDDDEDEPFDHLLRKRQHHPRYRQPRY